MKSPASCTERLDWAGSAWPVEGLGPGRRVALWVRGCRLACPGCMSPELWANAEPVPVEDVAAQLLPLPETADGLTISGGEPMDQPAALLKLIALLRRERPLEVMLYSGYQIEDIRRSGGDRLRLLMELDMLMDGPFMQHQTNKLQWRGSDNQRLHLLSAQAKARYGEQAAAEWQGPRVLTLQQLGGSEIRLVGIPRRGDLEAYYQALEARGLIVERGRADG